MKIIFYIEMEKIIMLFLDVTPHVEDEMNIFGLLGIFLLLSGLGSGYLAYVGIMEMMK